MTLLSFIFTFFISSNSLSLASFLSKILFPPRLIEVNLLSPSPNFSTLAISSLTAFISVSVFKYFEDKFYLPYLQDYIYYTCILLSAFLVL